MSEKTHMINGVPHNELTSVNMNNSKWNLDSYNEIFRYFSDYEGCEEYYDTKTKKFHIKRHLILTDMDKLLETLIRFLIYELVSDRFDRCYWFFSKTDGTDDEENILGFVKMFFGEQVVDNKIQVIGEFMFNLIKHKIEDIDIMKLFNSWRMENIMIGEEPPEWVFDEIKEELEEELKLADKIDQFIDYAAHFTMRRKREKEKKIALIIHTINYACFNPYCDLGKKMFDFRLKQDGLDEIIV